MIRKLRSFLLFLIILTGCNLDDDHVDPCNDRISIRFTGELREKYKSLFSTSIASNYHNEEKAENCDTINLMLWFYEDIGIETSDLVKEISNSFFEDSTHHQVGNVVLKLCASSPETKDKYLKKTTVEYLIDKNKELRFEEIYQIEKEKVNFMKGNKTFGYSYSDRKRNIMNITLEVDKDNPDLIDFEVLSIIQKSTKLIKEKTIEEITIEVNVIEPRFKIINFKSYKYHFAKTNDHF